MMKRSVVARLFFFWALLIACTTGGSHGESVGQSQQADILEAGCPDSGKDSEAGCGASIPSPDPDPDPTFPYPPPPRPKGGADAMADAPDYLNCPDISELGGAGMPWQFAPSFYGAVSNPVNGSATATFGVFGALSLVYNTNAAAFDPADVGSGFESELISMRAIFVGDDIILRAGHSETNFKQYTDDGIYHLHQGVSDADRPRGRD